MTHIHINVSKKQREWLFTCFLLLHNYIIIKLVTEDNRNALPYSFEGLKSKMSLSTTKKDEGRAVLPLEALGNPFSAASSWELFLGSRPPIFKPAKPG